MVLCHIIDLDPILKSGKPIFRFRPYIEKWKTDRVIFILCFVTCNELFLLFHHVTFYTSLRSMCCNIIQVLKVFKVDETRTSGISSGTFPIQESPLMEQSPALLLLLSQCRCMVSDHVSDVFIPTLGAIWHCHHNICFLVIPKSLFAIIQLASLFHFFQGLWWH